MYLACSGLTAGPGLEGGQRWYTTSHVPSVGEPQDPVTLFKVWHNARGAVVRAVYGRASLGHIHSSRALLHRLPSRVVRYRFRRTLARL